MTTFVDVAVPLGVRKTFAYSVPRALEEKAMVGARVLVPFGRKLIVRICRGSRRRAAGRAISGSGRSGR